MLASDTHRFFPERGYLAQAFTKSMAVQVSPPYIARNPLLRV